MLSPSPSKQHLSSINILFGQDISSEKTSFDIQFSLDIFSPKTQNLKFNFQQMLGITIQNNTLLIQLLAKNGYGSELEDKIITFLKSNKNYLDSNAKELVNIKAVGKGDKCYIFITSNEFSQLFNKISKLCQEFVQQKQYYNLNEKNAINFTIKSLNNCSEVRKLLDNQGAMRALFDSLLINISFNKSKLIQKILLKIFNELQIPLSAPLKAFNNLNLSLRFASSEQFDRYEKLRVFAKVCSKLQTQFFKILKDDFKDEVKVNYFNDYFSFSGKIYGQQIENLLQALFGQPQKCQ